MCTINQIISAPELLSYCRASDLLNTAWVLVLVNETCDCDVRAYVTCHARDSAASRRALCFRVATRHHLLPAVYCEHRMSAYALNAAQDLGESPETFTSSCMFHPHKPQCELPAVCSSLSILAIRSRSLSRAALNQSVLLRCKIGNAYVKNG